MNIKCKSQHTRTEFSEEKCLWNSYGDDRCMRTTPPPPPQKLKCNDKQSMAPGLNEPNYPTRKTSKEKPSIRLLIARLTLPNTFESLLTEVNKANLRLCVQPHYCAECRCDYSAHCGVAFTNPCHPEIVEATLYSVQEHSWSEPYWLIQVFLCYFCRYAGCTADM